MSKPIPTTKEQLVYFLHNNVSLGTYDRRFINNLVISYLTYKKPVTTNQNELLDKIITRYARQLHKFEIFAEQAVNLNWTITPIQSSPKYTQAHITLNEGSILVHSPFKQEFVKEFRETKHTRWDKEEKTWFVPYTEILLKQVINIVTKHYSIVNYCDSIKDVLKLVENYKSVKYWNPTLVYINNRLLVAASNASLDDAIKHIELNTELPTLARLVHYGITIDTSVIDVLPITLSVKKIMYAIERFTTLDNNNYDIIDYLDAVKPDIILLADSTRIDRNGLKIFKETIKEKDIPYKQIKIRDTIDVREYELPMLVNGYSFSTVSGATMAKVLTLSHGKINETM